MKANDETTAHGDALMEKIPVTKAETSNNRSAPEKYLTVAELNSSIRKLMDSDSGIHRIWLLGEFSNVKQYPSGHIYAALKDQLSEIRCIVWRGSVMNLRTQPKDGMNAFCFGDVVVSEQRGRYDFAITDIVEAGAGAFYLRVEQLKLKLRSEGMFDRKRAIPKMPSSIALITSEGGAVLHDMLKILARRFPIVRVLIFPVRVQGAGSVEEVVTAIRSFNSLKESKPDIIILARGGGSIEDLWTFNEERVARAIFRSEIPVITGIGHQTDFTIADFVSDIRAATPSEAAEKAVPDRFELLSILRDRQISLNRRLLLTIELAEQELDGSTEVLKSTMMRYLNDMVGSAEHYKALLDSLDPSAVLARGFASVTKNGSVVRSISDIIQGDRLQVTVTDGSMETIVKSAEKRSR